MPVIGNNIVTSLNISRKTPDRWRQEEGMAGSPGDTHFEIGDRIIDPMSERGTVKDIVEEDGKVLLRILFNKAYGGMFISVGHAVGKIRRIQ